MIDHIFGEVGLDAGAVTALPWQQACSAYAQHMFDALSRHGNVASLLIEYTPIGPNALANRELCLSVLLDNGFSPAVAAHAYATLARYVLGFAIQRSGSPPDVDRQDQQDQQSQRDVELSAVFHQLAGIPPRLRSPTNSRCPWGRSSNSDYSSSSAGWSHCTLNRGYRVGT